MKIHKPKLGTHHLTGLHYVTNTKGNRIDFQDKGKAENYFNDEMIKYNMIEWISMQKSIYEIQNENVDKPSE